MPLWDVCLALGSPVLPCGVQCLFGEWGGCAFLWGLSTVSWAVPVLGLGSLPTTQTHRCWTGSAACSQRSRPVWVMKPWEGELLRTVLLCLSGRTSYKSEGSLRSQISNFPEGLLHLSVIHFNFRPQRVLEGSRSEAHPAHSGVYEGDLPCWAVNGIFARSLSSPRLLHATSLLWQAPRRGNPAAWLRLRQYPSVTGVLGSCKQSSQGKGSSRGTVSINHGVYRIRRSRESTT